MKLFCTWNLKYQPRRTSGEGSECSNRISDANFLTVFHSTYGSILLSFWYMTMGWTTGNGMMQQPPHTWTLSQASN